MNIRQAKKIIFSRHWDRRLLTLRPSYYDEKKGVWVSPSFHDIPIPTFQKARRKYFGAFKRYKNRHGYNYEDRLCKYEDSLWKHEDRLWKKKEK